MPLVANIETIFPGSPRTTASSPQTVLAAAESTGGRWPRAEMIREFNRIN